MIPLLITAGKILSPTLVKYILDNSKGVLNNIKEETLQLFSDDLEIYLTRYENNFLLTKTILNRHEPVPFYDIYFPIKLSKLEPNRNLSSAFDAHSPEDVFLGSNHITIIGSAGSGKSTLVKHVFLSVIREKYAIPIIIELRNISDHDFDAEHYVMTKILENEIAQNGRIFKRLLEGGKFVFLIDGFDEIKREIRSKVIRNINEFAEKYHNNKFIITSRPGADLDLLPRFYNYKVNSLTEGDVYNFIRKQKISTKAIESVVDFLRVNKTVYLKTYLSNPLLLTLYLVTYSINSSIPDKKSIFYRRVFEVLFREHDSATKIGFERDFLTKMSQHNFEEILKLFSFISFFENEFSFTKLYFNDVLLRVKGKLKDRIGDFPDFDSVHFIEDLTVSVGVIVEDEGRYSFIHKTMQEYFAALFIQNTNVNKGDIYRKILGRLGNDVLSYSDDSMSFYLYNVQSLLSLCKEMDTFSYYRFVEIPLLEEALSNLDTSSDEGKIILYFKMYPCRLVVQAVKPSSEIADEVDNVHYDAYGIHIYQSKFEVILEEIKASKVFSYIGREGYKVPPEMLLPFIADTNSPDDEGFEDGSDELYKVNLTAPNAKFDWLKKDDLGELLEEANKTINVLKARLNDARKFVSNTIVSESSMTDLI